MAALVLAVLVVPLLVLVLLAAVVAVASLASHFLLSTHEMGQLLNSCAE